MSNQIRKAHHCSRWLALGLIALLAQVIVTAAVAATRPYEKIGGKVALAVRAFEPGDVRLLDGPFKRAFDDNTGFLLKIEPDRLLHRFMAFNGLRPTGDVYGGWESEGLSGHSLGHYLSACSLAYAASGDGRLLDRVTYIVDELARVQESRGDGYIGGIPDQDALIRDIETGNFFNVRQNYINNFWAPWYTIHKILAGLLDAHRCCGNGKALLLAERFGRWALRATRNLDDAAWQKMLYAEFGGMSESLADLYARTGDPAFMDLSRRFYHKEVLDPLAAGQDKLDGYHANCQIPKVIGAARDYEMTGDEKGRRIAEFFWAAVTRNHTYANGGNSEGEYFGSPGAISTHLTDDTSETCNTYNMLKLTRHLFTWEPRAAYADYAERALFNHILASTEPGTGMKCYYMPLTGEPKEYSTPFDSFWCCVGTGWENPPRYTDSIYFHDADSLYVNLFMASRLDWEEKGITITQETRFPEEEVTRLRIGGGEARFTMRIRRPFWAAAPVTVSLNGKTLVDDAKSGDDVTVDRVWKDGDILEIRLPMGIRVEATPDDSRRVSLFYGPILLAADLGPEGKPSAPVPVLVDGAQPLERSVRPAVGEGPLRFRTTGAGHPEDVALVPYYKSHHAYGPVYFERLGEAEWNQREAERRSIVDRTVDHLEAGDGASGKAHDLDTANAPLAMPMGHPAWEIRNEAYAYVSFELDPAGVPGPMEIRLSIWSGSEGGFEMTVNGVRVAQADVKKERPLRVKELSYPLPEDLIRASGRLKVWITPKSKMSGPKLFGAALLRRG